MNQDKSYGNLIDMNYDQIRSAESLRKHPRMQRKERAKIFMPFAALTGYEDAILDEQIIKTTRKSLSEEKKEEINKILITIQESLEKNIQVDVKVIYFSCEYEKYIQIKGKAIKVDSNYNKIVVFSEDNHKSEEKSKYTIEKPSASENIGKEIYFKDIYEIYLE
ncbi:hypothetical protein [Lachnobacterium bovis]|uniref:YolD-like protein n=1 Tax=Lachnobacterium bovis TaxID=140626 RepID=A0A1H9R5U4_9FIRM|nr:hypothetical protein [Lachnobacterium bovis]SER68068.1 hypothetical protein SAMN02910429_00783 [Lachnobacterium bovis]